MPLEIRELVIKATIGSGSEPGANTADSSESVDADEAYVNLVAEKVLEMLKEASER